MSQQKSIHGGRGQLGHPVPDPFKRVKLVGAGDEVGGPLGRGAPEGRVPLTGVADAGAAVVEAASKFDKFGTIGIR